MAKKIKAVRKTLKDRLEQADAQGYMRGVQDGRYQEQAHFRPNRMVNSALNDFVRAIGSWPLIDEGVVFIVGTDLKHGGSLSLPVRTMRAIASELKRLGYSNEVVER